MDDCHFQIAILYNDDIQVTRGEAQDLTAIQGTVTTAQSVFDALTGLGYATVKIAVRDSLDELESRLGSFSPNNTFIFNNCDGFAGNNHDAVKVVQLIERLGFRHTGAPSEAVELCIDKARSKERLIECGVPTPLYQVFTRPKGKCSLNLPVIVKPSEEDGSIGINLDSVVCVKEKLLPRVAHVIDSYQEPVVVEEFIPGRELTVAMLGNQAIEILPIAEQNYAQIDDPMKWLITYEAKWDPESPYYHNITSLIPAPLTPDEERIVRQAAETSFRAVGLRDFGRIDMRFYNNTPYVIDINELPDLALDAGYWKSGQAAGMSYPQLIERILRTALEREGWLA